MDITINKHVTFSKEVDLREDIKDEIKETEEGIKRIENIINDKKIMLRENIEAARTLRETREIFLSQTTEFTKTSYLKIKSEELKSLRDEKNELSDLNEIDKIESKINSKADELEKILKKQKEWVEIRNGVDNIKNELKNFIDDIKLMHEQKELLVAHKDGLKEQLTTQRQVLTEEDGRSASELATKNKNMKKLEEEIGDLEGYLAVLQQFEILDENCRPKNLEKNVAATKKAIQEKQAELKRMEESPQT